jgi:hypothetical protein
MKKPFTYTNILGEEVTVEPPKKPNPLVKAFGPGPEGKKCKDCVHLFRKKFANTYIKCDLRPNTGGPATDHRANWPACKKFLQKPD